MTVKQMQVKPLDRVSNAQPAPVAQRHKSITAVCLACVAARLLRSGFNPRLLRLVGHAGQVSGYSEINISGRHRGMCSLKSVTGC